MILIHKLKRVQHIASVSYVATATSSSANITIPSSAAVGDIAVLIDESAKLIGTVTGKVPTNWTQLKYLSPATNTKYYVSYKILVSGDPDSSIAGMSDSYNSKVMFVFRLSSGSVSAVNVAYNEGNTTSGNPTDYTTPVGVEPYIVVAGVGGGTGTGVNWTSLTPSANGSQVQGYIRGAYWVFNGSDGVAVAEVMGDWGTHTESSIHLLELS
jgi:hypothetical protein